MKIVLRWLTAAFCLISTLSAPASAQDAPIEVMTFNVRLPIASDGANTWENRRDLFIETITETMPDVIGTQELFKLQGDYLIERLPDYAWFGIDRRGGHADEHMGVFYRRDRLTLIELGNFWLSDTPTVPGSITWGHPLPRMATWAVFESKANGRRFYVVNTHFPYREEDGDARLKGAQAIADWIARIPPDMPVVLMGDFNAVPESPAYALLAGALTDVRTAAEEVEGPDATFHNFTGKGDKRIDWIMTRGFDPESVRTVTKHRGDRYPSDHFPVIAELDWITAPSDK